MPKTIASVVMSKKATLHELDTVYGCQDMWWLLEMHAVESYNRQVYQKALEKKPNA